MFFGSRKTHRSGGGASHPSASPTDENAERVSRQWDAWRRSARNVTRAWNEWSAAAGRERSELFGSYLAALSEEEQAAAQLERTVGRASGAHEVDRQLASTPGCNRVSPPGLEA